MDYNSGPYTVTFPAGERNVSLNISVNDDNIFENNERFALTINASLLPSDVYIGNLNRAIVIIMDNDGK